MLVQALDRLLLIPLQIGYCYYYYYYYYYYHYYFINFITIIT